MHEVIVIGAGKTGTVAANHLADHGVRNILVLDMGLAGRGSLTPNLVPRTAIPGLLGPHGRRPFGYFLRTL